MEPGRRVVLVGVLVVVIGVTVNEGLKLPTYIKGCSRNDPNLNECALKSAIDLFKSDIPSTGDRKYHVPIIDPLTITQLRLDNAGLILNYDDMKMLGLKNIVFKAIRINLKQLVAEYEFVIPELKIESKYFIKGQILVVPLAGEGQNNMTMTNVAGTMRQEFSFVTKKNGKKHLSVKSGFLNSELGSFKTSMEGLFNGDKRLGDHMNQFLNENWKEVVKEIKPSFNAALAKVADQIVDNLASLVPYSDMFPETL